MSCIRSAVSQSESAKKRTGALKAFLDREGVELHHVKPHGALYGMERNIFARNTPSTSMWDHLKPHGAFRPCRSLKVFR